MANKAIFLDRDNTLIEDPGYINEPDQVKLLEGVPETLIELRSLGYKLVVVTNQSAVARGIVTEEVLAQIHKRLEQLLEEKKAFLDRIYYCPYHPDGVIPKYRRNSDNRKPNPGMLLAAGKDMDIDLRESWIVGNSSSDIEAGALAGCKTILVDSRGRKQKLQPGERQPDYRAVNLKEVVNIIKMHARSAQKQQIITPPAAPPAAPPPIQRPVEEPQPQPALSQQPVLYQQPEPQPQTEPQQETAPAPPQAELDQTQITEQLTAEQLLSNILDQLKSNQRTNMFGEFAISRLLAGIIQVLVFFCLLVGIWFLLSPTRQLEPVLITLGFAILLQLMALTFYMMQGPK